MLSVQRYRIQPTRRAGGGIRNHQTSKPRSRANRWRISNARFRRCARAANDERESVRNHGAGSAARVRPSRLLYRATTPAKALEMAIAGETYEYTNVSAVPPPHEQEGNRRRSPNWTSRLKNRSSTRISPVTTKAKRFAALQGRRAPCQSMRATLAKVNA